MRAIRSECATDSFSHVCVMIRRTLPPSRDLDPLIKLIAERVAAEIPRDAGMAANDAG